MMFNWKLALILSFISLVVLKVSLAMKIPVVSDISLVSLFTFTSVFLYQRVDRTIKGLRLVIAIGMIALMIFCATAYFSEYILVELLYISLFSFGLSFVIWQYGFFRPYIDWKLRGKRKP